TISGPGRAAGTIAPSTVRPAPTASRRRCPPARCAGRARTGGTTRRRRSAGASPTSRGGTAGRAAPGGTSGHTTGTDAGRGGRPCSPGALPPGGVHGDRLDEHLHPELELLLVVARAEQLRQRAHLGEQLGIHLRGVDRGAADRGE